MTTFSETLLAGALATLDEATLAELQAEAERLIRALGLARACRLGPAPVLGSPAAPIVSTNQGAPAPAPTTAPTAPTAPPAPRKKPGPKPGFRKAGTTVAATPGPKSPESPEQPRRRPAADIRDERLRAVAIIAEHGPQRGASLAHRLGLDGTAVYHLLDHHWFEKEADGYHITMAAQLEAVNPEKEAS